MRVDKRVTFVGHPDNTNTVVFGKDAGDITLTTGYPLNAGQKVTLEGALNLNTLWFDADTNGEIVGYLAE